MGTFKLKKTIEGDGIVYDTSIPDLPTNKVFDQCVVTVRPKDKWRGEDYGFDWIRVGGSKLLGIIPSETNLPGDKEYWEIVGKYYKTINGQEVIEPDSNKYDGTFKKDGFLYNDLIRTSFPISYTIAWKKTNKTYIEDWKNNGELTKYTYYVPVMTLGVNKTANLRLIVDMPNKKTPPERIYIHNPYEDFFDISNVTLQPKKGNYECSIRCKEKFSREQFISIIAEYKKEDGCLEELLCGQLRVLPNRLLSNTVNLLIIKVQTNVEKKGKVGNLTSDDEENIKKILNQALLEYKSESVVLPIDINHTITDPQNNLSGGKLKNFIKNRVFYKTTGILNLCLWELERQYPSKYYDPCTFKIFIFGDNFSNKEEIVEGDTIKTKTSDVRGFAVKDYKAVVMFNNKKVESTSHELLHAMGLDHSFAAVDNGIFTYEAKITDNIMDYSTVRYNSWSWQWKLLQAECIAMNPPLLAKK